MALLFTGIIHGSLVQECAVKRRANSRFGLTVTTDYHTCQHKTLTTAPDYHKFAPASISPLWFLDLVNGILLFMFLGSQIWSSKQKPTNGLNLVIFYHFQIRTKGFSICSMYCFFHERERENEVDFQIQFVSFKFTSQLHCLTSPTLLCSAFWSNSKFIPRCDIVPHSYFVNFKMVFS